LKRRFSAALISFTPRSRVFAVAIRLNPRCADAPSPSSGIAMCFSDRIEISESWISGDVRVISSNRANFPSRIARSTGDATSAFCDGPSASSSA
jgi:hypothetical protein